MASLTAQLSMGAATLGRAQAKQTPKKPQARGPVVAPKPTYGPAYLGGAAATLGRSFAAQTRPAPAPAAAGPLGAPGVPGTTIAKPTSIPLSPTELGADLDAQENFEARNRGITSEQQNASQEMFGDESGAGTFDPTDPFSRQAKLIEAFRKARAVSKIADGRHAFDGSAVGHQERHAIDEAMGRGELQNEWSRRMGDFNERRALSATQQEQERRRIQGTAAERIAADPSGTAAGPTPEEIFRFVAAANARPAAAAPAPRSNVAALNAGAAALQRATPPKKPTRKGPVVR